MGGDDLDRIKGYDVVKYRKPIIDSKGQVDTITLNKMVSEVEYSDKAFAGTKYKFAFPCRIEGINAIYNYYVEFIKRGKWDFDYDIKAHYLPSGQKGSFPLEVVNTLRTVKFDK